ncbi:MAG: hypothetical protein CME70_09030 [Halobacteriovorax sp.]|nr:hypothetical protein [Halobacteriovorax sp.]|tara:strand:- start:39197 stop:39703 length:507 start_codon:yes stop_codon:yes gene_type:complete
MKFREKILSLEALFQKANELKETSKSLIHCHGTFDLLHPGHLKYFQEAKGLGNILVVTLTPDRFVNKGDGRPVFNEELRVESIASLEYVDFVALNNKADAVDLLTKLKPNIYVKGSDYKNHEDDPTGMISYEVQAVEENGGKVHYTNGIRFSSTDLINKYFISKKECR